MTSRTPPKEPDLATLTEDPTEEVGPTPLYVLRVMTGPDANKTLVLDWNRVPRVMVGQSRVAELSIQDPRVSRRHLAVAPEGHGVRVTDLGATNGTRVGGVRVFDVLLTGGEDVEIGGSILRLVRGGTLPEPPRTPRDRLGRVLGTSQEIQRVFTLAERSEPQREPDRAAISSASSGACGSSGG